MGLALNKLARSSLCPRCRYDMAGLADSALCPECGIVPTERCRLNDKRKQARQVWAKGYGIVTVLCIIPFLSTGLNLIGGVMWSDRMPWDPAFPQFVENGDWLLFDITADLTILGLLGVALAWPIMLLLLIGFGWSRWSHRDLHAWPWWIWLLMAFPVVAPFLLWHAGGTIVFPD